MNEELEKLQNEVKQYSERIEEICKTDSEINNLYKGTQIYFSPVSENPDFLFIGINPGSGFFKRYGIKVKKYSPLEKSEYETEEYNLQAEWKYVFGEKEKINNLPLLYKSPKINFSFLATNSTTELAELKTKLRRYFGNEYDIKEREWVKILISVIHPQILICEGFEVFRNLQAIYPKEDFVMDASEDWDVHKVAYLNKNITVMACKRICGRFIDIEDVVDTIYDFHKALNKENVTL